MKRSLSVLIMLLGTMTAVTAQTYENNIVKTRQQPLSMTRVTDGVWLADFGRDAFGQVEITVEGEVQCDSIILHLGECVRDGRIDHNPGGTRRHRTGVSLQIRRSGIVVWVPG